MSRKIQYPLPKPRCPYCKSNDNKFHGYLNESTKDSSKGPGNFCRFKCNVCDIVSTYCYFKKEYLYFKTNSEDVPISNYVTYDEWCKWASGYYSNEKVVEWMKKGKRYMKKYKVLHQYNQEQPVATQNALEVKEGDNL